MRSERPDIEAAYRQGVRSVLGLFALAALVAFAGPVLGYRSDLREIERLLHERVRREAELFASLLASRLGQMQAELSRLATRPELDPRDGAQALEEALLDFAHDESAVFRQGVAVFDATGEAIWSKPRLSRADARQVPARGWMRRTLQGLPTIDAFTDSFTDSLGDDTLDAPRFVVSVPVVRNGEVAGAVVGLIDAKATGLPERAPRDGLDLVVVDESGDVLMPARLPVYANTAAFLPEVERLLAHPRGDALGTSSTSRFAVARRVGGTGLRVVVAADEAQGTREARARFLAQMVTIASLQVLAVALLAMLFRLVTRRYVADERKARETARLVALGEASSLIAHEVKNALNGLNAATTFLEDATDRALGLRSIRGETARLGHLSNALLQFSRPGAARLQQADLVAVVNEALEAVALLPERDEVRIEAELPDKAEWRCDPLLVLTVVQNLVRNAIEATVAAKDSGTISHPEVRLRVVQDADELHVLVDDNAGPMPEQAQARLFEPFQSSKAKGVGLGLVMAMRAMQAQGGRLGYEPLPGGSRFRATLVRLPKEET